MEFKNFFIYLILVVFLSSFAHAFGIASFYSAATPLKVYPGQNTEFEISINNKGGSEGITAKGELVGGTEIAKIINPEEIYVVKADEVYPIRIKINIPSDAAIGKEYMVTVKFIEVSTPDGSGMVSMSTGAERFFPVIVRTKEEVLGNALPEKSFPWLIVISVSIIILLIGAYFLWRKNKKPVVETKPEEITEPAKVNVETQTPPKVDNQIKK